jgi:hypothetical protein
MQKIPKIKSKESDIFIAKSEPSIQVPRQEFIYIIIRKNHQPSAVPIESQDPIRYIQVHRSASPIIHDAYWHRPLNLPCATHADEYISIRCLFLSLNRSFYQTYKIGENYKQDVKIVNPFPHEQKRNSIILASLMGNSGRLELRTIPCHGLEPLAWLRYGLEPLAYISPAPNPWLNHDLCSLTGKIVYGE